MSLEPWLSPLFDAAGMREADRWAIEDRGVPSLELMEAAGGALAEAAEGLAGAGPVRIVCGKGNNGGDGLVAARLLGGAGHEVEVLLLWPATDLSPDAAANLGRFDGAVRELAASGVGEALTGSGVVIDAIFGTGFSGEPRDPAATAIAAINACEPPVVACDIGSGVDASTGEVEGIAVEADLTVTFHAAKLGHWIAPGKWHSGELRVVPIGIPEGAPSAPVGGLIEAGVLAGAPRRGPRSTKFSSGQVLIVGGSPGLTGAVCLAAEGAIRTGAGYATAAVPASLEPILEAKLTEVMTVGLPDAPAGEGEDRGGLVPEGADAVLERARRAACVVLGPGLGRSPGAAALVREIAPAIEVPLVIDADGLNALGTDLGLLAGRDAPSILTPHAGELGRLLGRPSAEVAAARLASARGAAKVAGAIVALKGDDTLITDGERLAINGLASPGLATAGSGDVLSGAIAALVARGMEPFAAAAAAVLAHARAGRLAADRVGPESVIAGDLIEALPGGLRVDQGSR